MTVTITQEDESRVVRHDGVEVGTLQRSKSEYVLETDWGAVLTTQALEELATTLQAYNNR